MFGAAASLAASFGIESGILIAVHYIRFSFLDYFFSFITGIFFLALCFLAAFALLLRKKKIYAAKFSISIVFSLLFSNVLKLVFARPRPDGIISLTPVLNLVNFSFPSSHAAFAFAFLPFMNEAYPKQKHLWWIIALAVAFSRIYIGVHYLSDVVAGAILGYLISWLISKGIENAFKQV